MKSTRITVQPLALAASLMTSLAACVYQPVPVLMQGSSAELTALAGKWQGEYYSKQSARSGVITLDVKPGKDTAYGEVVMDAGPGQRVTAEDARWGGHAGHAPAPEILRIAFVALRGGSVEGALEPYVAPDCKCIVRTTFTGRMTGDTIAGDFLTTGEYWLRQTGKWSVRRTRVAAR